MKRFYLYQKIPEDAPIFDLGGRIVLDRWPPDNLANLHRSAVERGLDAYWTCTFNFAILGEFKKYQPKLFDEYNRRRKFVDDRIRLGLPVEYPLDQRWHRT